MLCTNKPFDEISLASHASCTTLEEEVGARAFCCIYLLVALEAEVKGKKDIPEDRNVVRLEKSTVTELQQF